MRREFTIELCSTCNKLFELDDADDLCCDNCRYLTCEACSVVSPEEGRYLCKSCYEELEEMGTD